MVGLFRHFKTSPAMDRSAVLMQARSLLSRRCIEGLLCERGIDVSHDSVRQYWNRFGPSFAAEIRRTRLASDGADEREAANAPASPTCYGAEADPLYLWGPGPPGDIRLKRIYDPVEVDDGTRVLVDRLWPRGVKRAAARLHLWLPEVAPSPGLRRWFAHEPERWAAFAKQYEDELAERAESMAPLVDIAREGRLTLLFAAKDRAYNHAVVLREVLLRRLADAGGQRGVD